MWLHVAVCAGGLCCAYLPGMVLGALARLLLQGWLWDGTCGWPHVAGFSCFQAAGSTLGCWHGGVFAMACLLRTLCMRLVAAAHAIADASLRAGGLQPVVHLWNCGLAACSQAAPSSAHLTRTWQLHGV